MAWSAQLARPHGTRVGRMAGRTVAPGRRFAGPEWPVAPMSSDNASFIAGSAMPPNQFAGHGDGADPRQISHCRDSRRVGDRIIRPCSQLFTRPRAMPARWCCPIASFRDRANSSPRTRKWFTSVTVSTGSIAWPPSLCLILTRGAGSEGGGLVADSATRCNSFKTLASTEMLARTECFGQYKAKPDLAEERLAIRFSCAARPGARQRRGEGVLLYWVRLPYPFNKWVTYPNPSQRPGRT